jgi:hypothetical protein
MPNTKSRGCVKSADMKFGNDHIFDMASIDEGWDVVEKMSWSGVLDFASLPFILDRVILDLNKRTGRC